MKKREKYSQRKKELIIKQLEMRLVEEQLENMKSKQQDELLDTQDNNALKFEEVEGTPFTLFNEDGVYYGLCGNLRLTNGSNDKLTAVEELKEISWARITQVIYSMIEGNELRKLRK